MTRDADTDQPDPHSPQRLLVAVPNWIGDVVMATPCLTALRRQFPAAPITHLMRPYVSQVLGGSDLADAELYWPTKGNRPDDPRYTSSTWHLIRTLRAGRFDAAVLLTNSFRSAIVAALAGIPRRIGYARDRRSWLLTDKLYPPRTGRTFTPTPAIDYYNEIARKLGCPDVDRRMRLHFSPADEATAADKIESHDHSRPLIVLNPGANYGSAKCWPTEKYAALSDRLTRDHGARVIASFSPKEARMADQLRSAATEPIDIHVDLGIGPLKALIARSDLLISNDTGPRHFAPALGVPVVTIFGSSDPRWAETYADRERIVKLELDCQPCMERTCPLGHHNCMRELPVEMVLTAALELLQTDRMPLRVEAE